MMTLFFIWCLCALAVALEFAILYLPFVILYSIGDIFAMLLELAVLILLSPVVIACSIMYVLIIVIFDGITWVSNKINKHEDR